MVSNALAQNHLGVISNSVRYGAIPNIEKNFCRDSGPYLDDDQLVKN